MAADGCQEVAWKGNAFSYLLHHPTSLASQSYGDLRHQNAGANQKLGSADGESDARRKAASGTWDGPAPAGFLSKNLHGQSVAPVTALKPPPRDVFLASSKTRMPMLIASTAGHSDTTAAVRSALAAGYRAFDCSAHETDEAAVGAALKQFNGDRSELFIISKLWNDSKTEAALRASVQESITKLGCTYIDLLLIHWPVVWKAGTQTVDESVTLASTWAAMQSLVDEGAVKALGVANFNLQDVEALLEMRIKPVCNMVELHPQLSQRKMCGVLRRKGVQCIASSPTALLASEQEAQAISSVTAIATNAKVTASELLLKWNTQRGIPVVVNPASDMGNLDAFFEWRMSEEHDKVTLDAMDEGKRFFNPEWADFASAEEGGAQKPSSVFGY